MGSEIVCLPGPAQPFVKAAPLTLSLSETTRREGVLWAMPETGKLFLLPDRTRGAPDAGLQDFLRQNRDASIRISAGSVTRLDVRLLQLILSAAQSWQERGLDLCLCDIPEPVARTLRQLGVAPEMLRQEGVE
jgi:hypothetical protein